MPIHGEVDANQKCFNGIPSCSAVSLCFCAFLMGLSLLVLKASYSLLISFNDCARSWHLACEQSPQ